MDSLTFGEQNGGGLVMNFCETRNSINQENQFNGTMSKCLKIMYLKMCLNLKLGCVNLIWNFILVGVRVSSS